MQSIQVSQHFVRCGRKQEPFFNPEQYRTVRAEPSRGLTALPKEVPVFDLGVLLRFGHDLAKVVDTTFTQATTYIQEAINVDSRNKAECEADDRAEKTSTTKGK